MHFQQNFKPLPQTKSPFFRSVLARPQHDHRQRACAPRCAFPAFPFASSNRPPPHRHPQHYNSCDTHHSQRDCLLPIHAQKDTAHTPSFKNPNCFHPGNLTKMKTMCLSPYRYAPGSPQTSAAAAGNRDSLHAMALSGMRNPNNVPVTIFASLLAVRGRQAACATLIHHMDRNSVPKATQLLRQRLD